MKAHLQEYLHLLIALFMGLLIFFGLSPTNGLTQQGVMLLAIVAPTIYLWLFVNTHWVSLLFLALLAMTGIMTPNQVWAGALGHFSIMLVLVFSILSESLNETGAIGKIANWFISRPFVQGRPYAFMGMFFAGNLIIGIFMQNLALAVMFVALTARICESLGIKKGEPLYNCFMLGTFWGNSVLSIASPIAKSLPNILIGLVDTNFGIQITYAQWLMVGIPFMTVMFGVIMVCIRVVNPDTTPLKNFKVADIQNVPLSIRGKISLSAMGILILLILLPELFLLAGWLVPISSYFIRMGATIPAIVLLIGLCILRVKENGEYVPVLDFSESTKHVPIKLLLFVAAVVIMGVPMASAATGVIDWLHYLISPLTVMLSPFVLIVVLVLISVILTNFLSNTVVLTISTYLGSALIGSLPMGAAAFAVLIAFASSMACLTPSSVMTAPLYYGPEHLKVKEVAKFNTLFLALATAVLIAFIPLFTAVMG